MAVIGMHTRLLADAILDRRAQYTDDGATNGAEPLLRCVGLMRAHADTREPRRTGQLCSLVNLQS